MEQQVLAWITQYGYLAIFSLLVLGIVGLPVPDETLLTFTGYLVFCGNLSLPLAFLAAFAGSACGITLSYVLGRTFGFQLIHRYGSTIHITEDRLNTARRWLEHAGSWSLTFGYFLPGVRHVTAYLAGTSKLNPAVFSLFAYSGGLLWSATFVMVVTTWLMLPAFSFKTASLSLIAPPASITCRMVVSIRANPF